MEQSKLHMTKLSVLFGLYMIRAVDCLIYQSVFMQENETFYIFTKIIPQVILKLLPISLLLEASLVTFSTQKIFQIIKMCQLCFQNFSMESQLCNKFIQSFSNDPTLLMQRTKSKSVIYASRVASDDLKTCPYAEFCFIF